MSQACMASPVIDLGDFVTAGVTVLAGRDRGSRARLDLKLSAREDAGECFEVHLPDTLATVTMSFLLGLLADSVKKLQPSVFRERYEFTGPDAADLREELIAKALRTVNPLAPPGK